MIKSMFIKYLILFAVIIVVSFSMLSGIFTAMIRSYSKSEQDRLLRECSYAIAKQIETETFSDMSQYVASRIPSRIVFPIVSMDRDIDILISDRKGAILLTTVTDRQDGHPLIFTEHGDLGRINLSEFREYKDEQGTVFCHSEGTLSGLLEEKSRIYGEPVVRDGETVGYIFVLRSMAAEDALVGVVKSAVFTSSVWVTIAGVIAVYFITERMMHPLREITGATKIYAKGDFSKRVEIYGDDEIAELGRAFNRMADGLEKTEKMRNSFLANISHDLRTPMTTIAGFIDGINSGAIPHEKQEYYLGVISGEVHRLSRLVSQLLDVSRLESGERQFTYSDFNVAEVARLILISFEQKIEEKRLDVIFGSEDSVMVHADKDAIYQVLYNLCHNAIKFSKEGGKFIIRIETPDRYTAKLSVYDEGQSISEEEIPFVFDRFYKTDKSRGLDKNGIGLGLYICKTIIDAHGETIAVRSVEGESCEFSFTLRRAAEPPRKTV